MKGTDMCLAVKSDLVDPLDPTKAFMAFGQGTHDPVAGTTTYPSAYPYLSIPELIAQYKAFLEHADVRVMLIDPGTGQPPLGFHVGPGKIEGEVDLFFHGRYSRVDVGARQTG